MLLSKPGTNLPRPYQTLIAVPFRLPVSISRISVGADGEAWAADSANLICKFDATQGFNLVGTGFTDVFIGNAVSVRAVNRNTGFTYYWFLAPAKQTRRGIPGYG